MDWIQEIHIDEDGLYQPKGKNETDHNEDGYQTLRRQMARRVVCYLKAAPEKWELYKANMGEAKMEF